MRIAMLAPISWPLPPTGYGPWEQVAYNLTEELVDLGHDVTLFAAGGSVTRAELVETCPHALSTWPEEQRSAPRRFDPKSGLLEGPPDAERVRDRERRATRIRKADRLETQKGLLGGSRSRVRETGLGGDGDVRGCLLEDPRPAQLEETRKSKQGLWSFSPARYERQPHRHRRVKLTAKNRGT